MTKLKNEVDDFVEIKTIIKPSKLKIILRTVAVIMLIFGFSITSNMPNRMYGLSWSELGALAEGCIIEDVESVLKFADIADIKDVGKLLIVSKKAEKALKRCIALSCAYWFVCGALLFIHIKDKEVFI